MMLLLLVCGQIFSVRFLLQKTPIFVKRDSFFYLKIRFNDYLIKNTYKAVNVPTQKRSQKFLRIRSVKTFQRTFYFRSRMFLFE